MTLTIILISIILILALWGLYKYLSSENQEDIDTLYTRGLDHMIRDETEEAIECFRDYVKENTEKIDVYIKLGMLLRKEEQAEKALSIHRSLLYRRSISESQRKTVLIQIVEDYRSLGKLEKALETTDKIFEIDEDSKWARKAAWQLCRELEKWEQAFEHLNLYYQNSEPDNRLLCIYKTREGVSQIEEENYKEARNIFKKAIEYDDECEAPFYFMAELFLQQDKPEKAVKWWKKYIEIAPEKAFYFYPEIKKTLFNIGEFDQLADIYENILERVPEHPETTLALAEYLYRRGETNRAVTMVKNIINSNPEYIKAKLSLLKLLMDDEDIEANKLLSEIIEDIEAKKQNVCSNCGYKTTQLRWICPGCGMIDTYFKD